ncbi:MAG: DsbA family protein [Streptosporangiales bacterium]
MASRKEQKAQARERMRQEMERRKRRARRNRIIGVVAGATAVVVAAVVVGIVVQTHRAKDEGPAPKGAVANNLAIPVGQKDAPVTLTVYEDFRCPACKQFEQRYDSTIGKLVEAGKLRVRYHIATIIDANYPGTEGSKLAGNAAACAFEEGKFTEYHDVLYQNQPPETTDGFTTEQLLKLAKNVKGLKGNDTFESCVKDETYVPWLKRVQKEFDTRFNGRVATPSFLLDGEVMLGGKQQQIAPQMRTPQAFEQTVEKRYRKRTG